MQVSTAAGSGARASESPDIAIAPDGTAYAVWTDDRSGFSRIYLGRLLPGATTWIETELNADGAPDRAEHEPQTVTDAAGNLTVAWIGSGVQSRTREAGTGLWGSVLIVSGAFPLCCISGNLALASSAEGSLVTAWVDQRAGSGIWRIWGSEFDRGSGTWSAPELIGNEALVPQEDPTLAYRGGILAVAWKDAQSDIGDIRARVRTTSQANDRISYAYDGLNRLVSATGAVPESFTFDGATNIAARTGPAATYTMDGANRVTSDGARTFTWNGADQLVQRGADTFTYDALGRMTASTIAGVPTATTRSYAYDGDGLLRGRTQGAATTSYLWDASSAPAPLLAAGSDRVVHGLGPLYLARADGSTLTLVRDALGSVRAEVTDAGVIAKAFRYAAYGEIAVANPLGATPTLLGFTGELRDPSGLSYLRARWYDAGTGRFMSRDAFPGSSSYPVSLNAFAYVAGRPTGFTDPSGLVPARANWAYAIATVFADLDSPNEFRRATAYVTVAAGGFAIAGLLAAGVAATGVGAAAYTAPLVPKVAVIGENQQRVMARARELGGAVTMPRIEASNAVRLARNRDWIQNLMDEGYTIHNIGRDPERIREGRLISEFFQAELEEIVSSGYTRVVPGAWPVVP